MARSGPFLGPDGPDMEDMGLKPQPVPVGQAKALWAYGGKLMEKKLKIGL